jgi:hypothetical protein
MQKLLDSEKTRIATNGIISAQWPQKANNTIQEIKNRSCDKYLTLKKHVYPQMELLVLSDAKGQQYYTGNNYLILRQILDPISLHQALQ